MAARERKRAGAGALSRAPRQAPFRCRRVTRHAEPRRPRCLAKGIAQPPPRAGVRAPAGAARLLREAPGSEQLIIFWPTTESRICRSGGCCPDFDFPKSAHAGIMLI